MFIGSLIKYKDKWENMHTAIIGLVINIFETEYLLELENDAIWETEKKFVVLWDNGIVQTISQKMLDYNCLEIVSESR